MKTNDKEQIIGKLTEKYKNKSYNDDKLFETSKNNQNNINNKESYDVDQYTDIVSENCDKNQYQHQFDNNNITVNNKRQTTIGKGTN